MRRHPILWGPDGPLRFRVGLWPGLRRLAIPLERVAEWLDRRPGSWFMDGRTEDVR